MTTTNHHIFLFALVILSIVASPGAAGPIPALCVLPTWTDSASSSPSSSSFGGGGGLRGGAVGGPAPGFYDLGMMAMSSWKNTFIVGIHPEVRKDPRNTAASRTPFFGFLSLCA